MLTNSGIVVTGHGNQIDGRTINLPAGAIPQPAGVEAPPGTRYLPRPPANVFVGRDSALGQLRGVLDQDASAVVTQAVYGLGGVGKSELALHHATVHQGDYPLIWWIDAENETRIQNGLAALAARLCPAISTRTTADEVSWAVGWLQAHHGWLLILDNVNEPGDVESLLGQLHGGGHILITTRRDAGWERIPDPICLDVLDATPAAEVLTSRTGHHDTLNREAAVSVARELGCLPLALDQAASYIRETRITLPAYLQQLRQDPSTMHAAADSDRKAEQTISRVWDITFQAIQKQDAAAIQLLHVLACYAPDGVPRDILGGKGKQDEKAKRHVTEQLVLLASYSMITLTEQMVSMHRLVQAVLHARQPPGKGPPGGGDSLWTTAIDRLRTMSRWLIEDVLYVSDGSLSTALNWLFDAIPKNPETEVTAWPLLRALIPHVDNVARFSLRRRQLARQAWIQIQLGKFQRSQAQYEGALALVGAAQEIYKSHWGTNHRHTGTALLGLAGIYRDLGQADKALPMGQEALGIYNKSHWGVEPADTATALGDLAMTYSDLGQADKALPLQQLALQITEKALGPDHPTTATALNNLAITYRELGQADKALPLQQLALQITEQALGLDHPATAIARNNLAGIYRDLGHAKEALPLQRRGLQITEQALGPDHPATATALGNLAMTYGGLGRAEEALPLQRRALQITEQALGPNHPTTALQLNNLALIYSEQGQNDKALPLQRRALQITEEALGPEHPTTALQLNNLAAIHRELGQAD